jgi:hypothetical protein
VSWAAEVSPALPVQLERNQNLSVLLLAHTVLQLQRLCVRIGGTTGAQGWRITGRHASKWLRVARAFMVLRAGKQLYSSIPVACVHFE